MDDVRLTHSFPVIVSHVCRQWRNAALSTASLWTGIVITPATQAPYHRVAIFLERSKCIPIDIRICLGSQTPTIHLKTTQSMADVELLYSYLVAHVHRWRSIDVKGVSHQQMYAFLGAISDSTITVAAQLRSLVLSANQAIDNDVLFRSLILASNFAPFCGSAPFLQHVSLVRVSVDWNQDWISCASRLTTLVLKEHFDDTSPSWDAFASILLGAPALERLVLDGSGPASVPSSWDADPDLGLIASPDPNPIQLLKLKDLSLSPQSPVCVYALLRSLYMPALRRLAIDFFWDDYTEFLAYITAPATIPATLSIDEQPRSLLRSLEALDISCLWCKTEFVATLYDELENLESLKLSMNDAWYYPAGCTLIFPLLPSEARGNCAVSPRLPRLKILTISHVSSVTQFQIVRNVVQQRNDAGFSIESLYVSATCDMDEEDAMWFRENLETFVFSRQYAKP